MKTQHIQSPKNEFYNNCAVVCKAAVIATAIITAGVVLHYFLRDTGPACSAILQDLERKQFIGHDELHCFKLQQKAVGIGSPEECRAALSNYHPAKSSTLDVVEAMGGSGAFCNLPSVQLEETLDRSNLNALVIPILEKGSVRGIDPTSYHLLTGVRTSVTETRSHPDIPKRQIEEDAPYAEIYFHSYADTKMAWQTASCHLGQQWCSPEKLEDRGIEDLGSLVKGETICGFSPSFSLWICKRMF